jgi:hypothetical protein
MTARQGGEMKPNIENGDAREGVREDRPTKEWLEATREELGDHDDPAPHWPDSTVRKMFAEIEAMRTEQHRRDSEVFEAALEIARPTIQFPIESAMWRNFVRAEFEKYKSEDAT